MYAQRGFRIDQRRRGVESPERYTLSLKAIISGPLRHDSHATHHCDTVSDPGKCDNIDDKDFLTDSSYGDWYLSEYRRHYGIHSNIISLEFAVPAG